MYSSKKIRSLFRHVVSKDMSQLIALFGPLLSLCSCPPFRCRLFTPDRIFWLFLSQIFSADGSCREALCKAHLWLAQQDIEPCSSSTSAYCQGRRRIKVAWLRGISQRLINTLLKCETKDCLWCGRSVKVVDGTGLVMADTPQNQAQWSQSKCQAKGCGYPAMNLVAVFSLATGIFIGMRYGPGKTSDRSLLRKLYKSTLVAGDVLLADRGFCGYAAACEFLEHKVDFLFPRNTQLLDGKSLVFQKKLGKNDRLLEWRRPKSPTKFYTTPQWKQLDESITVREVTVIVAQKGMRAKKIVLLTSLLDHKAYTLQSISELYYRRWNIELWFRDIKITMGMDMLRCKTPDMVRKELLMYMIGYNLIRGVMMDASQYGDVEIERISFKKTWGSVINWAAAMVQGKQSQVDTLYERFLLMLSDCLNPVRTGRREPRAKKQRPKKYPLLNTTRANFIEPPSRNDQRREQAKRKKQQNAKLTEINTPRLT